MALKARFLSSMETEWTLGMSVMGFLTGSNHGNITHDPEVLFLQQTDEPLTLAIKEQN